MDGSFDLPAAHFHQYVLVEPALSVSFAAIQPFEISARASDFQINDAIARQLDELMAVAADDIVHAVFQRQFVQWKFAAVELQRQQPERLMEQDELRSPGAILGEVTLKKLQLAVIEGFGLTVVKHREVGVLVVEAVWRRMAGLFAKDAARRRGPDIVITGSKELLVLVAVPERAQGGPLSRGRGVIAAFYGVADVDDEIGMQPVYLAPDLLVGFLVGSAGAVAKDGKSECIIRGALSSQPRGEERQQHRSVEPPHAVILAIPCAESYWASNRLE